MHFAALGAVLAFAVQAWAQSSSSADGSASLSLSLSTSVATITTSTRRGNENVPTTIVSSSVLNVTYTPTPTSSNAANASASASAEPTPEPIVLSTIVDPAFGVLGGILILTGLPSAFWGHKNRWTSFFLIGFYTLSLVCFVLITKFGILNAVNPPNKTIRGMFVLASGVAGVVGGAISIFFWKGARYFIGAWGGFAFALWIQCFRNGGLIRPVAMRWILYIGSAVVGFTLCTIPKIHYHVLLVSTAIVGASATILGADCFTTAGLKEFYVWNIGFKALFTKFVNNGIEFPVSQTMQIELGMIAAVAVMGAAVQLRILGTLQRKLEEIKAEQKKQDEEAETAAGYRFDDVQRERDAWEKDHPSPVKHNRYASGLSGMPLLRDHDGLSTPTGDKRSSYTLGPGEQRSRTQSGLSDLMTAPAPEDENRKGRGGQPLGSLPALDLGMDLGTDVPTNFISDAPRKSPDPTTEKDALLSEIQGIRHSIEALRSESGSASGSRHPSLTSRRTLSIEAANALSSVPSHLRPPRETNPRGSMEMSALEQTTMGASIGRPSSAPLRDNDWDNYVRERKLMQPPQGVTAPISPSPSPRLQMPQAVSDAVNQRRNRESRYLDDGDEDIPLARKGNHRRSNSAGAVTILPPRQGQAIATPTPSRPTSRVKTFEELEERHREKMKGLQGPVTEAQKEKAEVDAAKQRWERSKAAEREAVNRRQAEQAERRKRSGDDSRERTGRRSSRHLEDGQSRHSRSLSADKLAALGGVGSNTSKRLSTMKVEDWQKYQQEVDSDEKQGRDSKKRDSLVPFPDASRQRGSGSYNRRS